MSIESAEEKAERNPATLRDVQRKVNGEFVSCRMKDLVVGDTMRFADDVAHEFKIASKPYVNEFFVWTVMANIIEYDDVEPGPDSWHQEKKEKNPFEPV